MAQEEDPFEGGEDGFEVMAPMLVDKLQVGLSINIPSVGKWSLFQQRLTQLIWVGRRHIRSRYKETVRGWISYRRIRSFHAKETALDDQGDQRGQGG